MGASPFLDHDFVMEDHRTQGLHHGLDLYEQGNELFLRVWIGGRGSDMPLLCRLTQAQAEQLAEGAQRLATRLSPG